MPLNFIEYLEFSKIEVNKEMVKRLGISTRFAKNTKLIGKNTWMGVSRVFFKEDEQKGLF